MSLANPPSKLTVTLPRPPPARRQQYGMAMADPFLFVPITKAEAAKGRGSTKRIVRAHVTRVQHARSAALSANQDLQDWVVKPQKARRSGAALARKSSDDSNKSKTSSSVTEVELDSPDDVLSSEPSSTTSMALIKRTSPISLPSPKIPTGTAQADPFWTYPVERLAFIPTIIHHYILNVAVDIPDIDGPCNKGLLRTSWFPLVMTEPTTFYAVLLMAASHYCIVQPNSNHLIDLLSLKTRALKAINMALKDPVRAKSDAVIGAVAKMAAYEAVFGDSATFTAHMRGLQMMLNLRGSLADLGLNGLLERMLVWIDLNAAHITGLQKSLGNEAFPSVVEFAAPDPFHFAGIS